MEETAQEDYALVTYESAKKKVREVRRRLISGRISSSDAIMALELFLENPVLDLEEAAVRLCKIAIGRIRHDGIRSIIREDDFVLMED